MADPKQRVQYPELNGSEQHHDLKNDPGKQGDPRHTDKTEDLRDMQDEKEEK